MKKYYYHFIIKSKIYKHLIQIIEYYYLGNMGDNMRKLDNVAKIFSLEEDSNIFRLSINLKENVDKNILKKSIYKTLEKYPFLKLRQKKDFFGIIQNITIKI